MIPKRKYLIKKKKNAYIINTKAHINDFKQTNDNINYV